MAGRSTASCSHLQPRQARPLTATAGRRVRGERHCAAGGPRSSRCRLAACSVCAGPTMRAFARSAAVLRREPQLGVMAQQPRLRCCAVLRSSYNRRAARWRNVLCAAAAMVGLRGAAMCCAAPRPAPGHPMLLRGGGFRPLVQGLPGAKGASRDDVVQATRTSFS